jgi:hypothetical protein
VVKVLKPLKGSSCRLSSIAAPILIRTPRKEVLEQEEGRFPDSRSRHSRRSEIITLERIYKHQPKRNQWFERRDRKADSEPKSQTIDVTEGRGKKVDILINNNINLFISEQMRGLEEDKNITIEVGSKQRRAVSQKGQLEHREIEESLSEKKILQSGITMRINVPPRRHPYLRRQILARRRPDPGSKKPES